MTLRRRLTWNFALVALLSLLLASIAGVLLVRRIQMGAAERTAGLFAQVVAARADEGPLNPTSPALWRQVETVGGRLLAVDRSGTVIVDSGGDLLGVQLRRPVAEALRPGSPRIVRQVRLGGQPYYLSAIAQGVRGSRLVVAIPVATLLGSWLGLLPGILGLSALGGIVAAAVGSRLAQRLTVPVTEMTDATRQMAAGDYDIHVGTLTEVQELQTLAESFNTMASEVKQARQTQRDFLANVSHDLRTPLTSIQGFSQAMIDGAVPEGQTTRVAGIIHTEAGRLSRLVGDLLDLARIEAGRFSLVQRDLNLNAVLEQCAEKFYPQAETMGVALDVELPRRPLPIHGDADRLEQVITNLMDNALTYAQEGGGHVRLVGSLGGIRGALKTAGSNGHSNGDICDDEEPSKRLGRWWIEIKIQDDGPGIPDEQKPLVFERFYRAQPHHSMGTGLGLAIAREIVQAHGGDIAIQDGATEGTEFVVRLPMKMK